MELLLSLPRLRAVLDAARPAPPLDARALEQLRVKLDLTQPELVGVFTAHADLLARA